MKVKTKLIASIMSICLVCAVFAIGVFALKTANLKIGGDVSFQATGVEAHIKNASVSGAVTPTTLAANDAEGEVINTSMTQADIDSKFQNWQTLELDFDQNATDIELKFDIANTSTNADNYIEIDYSYSFSNSSPNVDVFPGDENDQSVWENNEYILAPKGSAETATYETFTLKFKVLDKELNVPQDTKVNLTIALKHITPVNATGVWNFVANSPNAGEATLQETETAEAFTVPQNWNGVLDIPAVITDGTNNYIVTKLYSIGGILDDPANYCFVPSATIQVNFPNSIKEIQGAFSYKNIIGLTAIEFPISLTSTGADTFFDCSVITSITIPNSVTTIGFDSFFGCTGLTSIIIPSSVTSIEGYAFSGCSSLASIAIPSSVTEIQELAFSSCSNLTSAKFENPNGWFTAASADATTGTTVTVTSGFTEDNANVLKNHSSGYLLRKNA
ncbi:MAG: leucine-rich repeat domain-containing protein [Clostridia bacterium]|nr:leucine-rich repeat domain-containing protein [Clostridia bacterium]